MSNAEKSSKPAADSQAKTKTSSNAKPALIIAIIAVVIAVVAVIVAGISLQRLMSVNANIAAQVQSAQTSSTQSSAANQANIQTLRQELSTQQQSLASLQNKVIRVIKGSANVGRQRALSQAAYLLHLANLHLMLNHDAAKAHQLLESAQKRLQNLAEPELFSVKHAIANDLSALKQVPTVNTTNIVLTLDRINHQIQQLPLITPLSEKPKFDQQAQTQKAQHWYDRILQSFEGLKDLVIIRHIRQPIMPLLTPQEQVNIKANIQSKLLQAQWAVLHRNQKLFQASLNDVSQWLAQYWQEKDVTKAIRDRITQLQAMNIAPTLPNLKNSLEALTNTLSDQASPEAAPSQTQPGKTKQPNHNAAPKNNVVNKHGSQHSTPDHTKHEIKPSSSNPGVAL